MQARGCSRKVPIRSFPGSVAAQLRTHHDSSHAPCAYKGLETDGTPPHFSLPTLDRQVVQDATSRRSTLRQPKTSPKPSHGPLLHLCRAVRRISSERRHWHVPAWVATMVRNPSSGAARQLVGGVGWSLGAEPWLSGLSELSGLSGGYRGPIGALSGQIAR